MLEGFSRSGLQLLQLKDRAFKIYVEAQQMRLFSR